MLDFIYQNKTKLIFGRDTELLVGSTLKDMNVQKALIVYGQGSVKKSGLLDKIEKSLTQSGIQFVEHGGVSANPLKSHTLAGVDLARTHKADFVLAVGGGSVIDEAKCIAAGAVNDNIWEFFVHDINPKQALPIGAVLTIPAAGSESSIVSVVRQDNTGRKLSIRGEALRPILAFVNPEHCFTLPKNQIANGISDILAHLMERYFSPQQNVTASDKILCGTMQALMELAPKVYADNTNYDLWSEVCLIGTLAHNGMLDMGRSIQDWASHRIENSFLSGVYNCAHGAGLSALFPAWLKYVAKSKPSKIEQFCREVMSAEGQTTEQAIAFGIEKLEAFYTQLDLPTRLSHLNIDADEVKKLAKEAYTADTRLGGYGQLNVCDIEQMIDLAK